MLFEVHTTSDAWKKEKQPCKGAFKAGDIWVVEIKSLKALLAFSDEVEQEIVFNSCIGGLAEAFEVDEALEIAGTLEIYDDYRE